MTYIGLDQTVKIKTPKEEQIEQERLAELLIVLEELFQREEATAKRVIGCVYDIAVINWVNQNVPGFLNPLVKYGARFPRGIAQHLGLKFFLQPKCPKLITDWLYSLVEFAPAPKQLPQKQTEVEQLQKQVRLLTGSLIFTVVLSIGSLTLLWQRERLQELLITKEQLDLPKNYSDPKRSR